jgi:hypothetical protein
MSCSRVRHGWADYCAPALIAGVALAFSTSAAVAQTSNRSITPFSAVYIATGTFLMDVSKLNPHFERTDIIKPEDRPGYYTLSNDGYSVGIGGYGSVLDRLLVGGEWHMADLGQEASPSGKTNAMTSNYFMGTVGYAAFTAWRVNVTPFLGLGLGSASLTLKNRSGGSTVPDTQDPTFDEVVMSPGLESVMKGAYVMVQPGLRIDFLLLRESTSRGGVVLGFHASSALSPNRTTWTYKGREVFGGPDLGPVGGMVRLVAGIGGFRLGGAPGR